jgi:hypothetical protein
MIVLPRLHENLCVVRYVRQKIIRNVYQECWQHTIITIDYLHLHLLLSASAKRTEAMTTSQVPLPLTPVRM